MSSEERARLEMLQSEVAITRRAIRAIELRVADATLHARDAEAQLANVRQSLRGVEAANQAFERAIAQHATANRIREWMILLLMGTCGLVLVVGVVGALLWVVALALARWG